VKSRFRRAFLLLLGVLLLAAPTATANVRLTGGETLFYARIESVEIFHSDEWAVIAFYCPPACVSANFNLLALFDVPGAFACRPSTIDGFTIWRNGPETDPAPIQAEFHGLGAVPIWFVLWPAFEAAVADDVLTIGELAALPSRHFGSTRFYEETLHPEQAAPVGELEFVAHGTLEDGSSFATEGVLTFAAGHRFPHVRIVFG
jgi:hypothetical protein